jgi:hypothetical protein
MSTQSRTMKDQRSVSRVTANLGCQFTFEGAVHDGYIVNLSLNGAFLRSLFIPPEGSHIAVTLKTPLAKNILTLESEVVRTDSALKDGVGAFAVRFSYSSLDLIELIKNLISQPPLNKVQKLTLCETKTNEK